MTYTYAQLVSIAEARRRTHHIRGKLAHVWGAAAKVNVRRLAQEQPEAFVGAVERFLHRGKEVQDLWDALATLSGDHELLGVLGEAAFAAEFGYEIRTEPLRNSATDGGFDFDTPLGTVDVKTARYLYGLKQPTYKKRVPDYVFLALYRPGNQDAQLLGWATREEILVAPVQHEKEHDNYVLPVEALHRIEEFHSLLVEIEKEGANAPT